jgi:hypothetical protein
MSDDIALPSARRSKTWLADEDDAPLMMWDVAAFYFI